MAVIHRGNEKLKEDLKQLGRVRVTVLLGALAAAAVCALLIVYAIPWLKDLLSAAAGTVLFKVLQTVHYICIGGLVLSVLCIIGSFGRREGSTYQGRSPLRQRYLPLRDDHRRSDLRRYPPYSRCAHS